MGVYRSKRTRRRVVLLSALPLAFGLLGLVQPWHDEWFVNESFHYPGAFLFAGGVTLLMSGLLNRVKLTEAGFALHNGSGHKHVLRREHVAEIWHVDWKPSPVYVRDHWGRVFTVGTAAYDVEYARYLVQVMRAHWRANLPEMPPARPTTHPGSVPSMRPVTHPGSHPAMRPAYQAPAPEGRAAGSAAPPAQPTT